MLASLPRSIRSALASFAVAALLIITGFSLYENRLSNQNLYGISILLEQSTMQGPSTIRASWTCNEHGSPTEHLVSTPRGTNQSVNDWLDQHDAEVTAQEARCRG